MGRLAVRILLAAFALAAGCTGATSAGDAGDAGTDAAIDTSVDALLDAQDTATVDSGPRQCTNDTECTDGLFCNGVERCMPGHASADARGCVAPAASSPCAASQTCDEARARCVSQCGHEPDADGDGHRASDCGGDDCDDSDARRFPGNPEVCDTSDHDEDCDPATFGVRDGDGDGFADSRCCNTASATVRHCGDDCDDARATVHPAAPETCDTFDNDCNGTADDGVMLRLFADSDGDGYGNASMPMTVSGCTTPSGAVANNTDCDDTNAGRNPGAPEVCDGVDNDCDTMIDEGVSRTFYADVDGDGFGAAGSSAMMTTGCAPPVGFAANRLDCDDTIAARNPAAPEVCDGLDNDCDTMVDEGVQRTYYADGDRDGFGAMATTVQGCTAPTGYVDNALDCDDTTSRRSPAFPEVCDGLDNDCDAMVDEGALRTFYSDTDGDFFGDASGATRTGCVAPVGFVENNQDCDDANWSNRPGGYERCDGVDNDCDGMTDEGAASSCPTVANTTFACTAGACVVATCATSWSNCNGAAADGCETNTSASAAHCGACGRSCGVGGLCTGGTCDGLVGLAVGGDHACVLRGGGAVACWGANAHGQLGNGTLNGSPRPVAVIGLPAAPTQIYAGGAPSASVTPAGGQTCVVAGGRLYCWGSNERGQMGNGTLLDALTPTNVAMSGDTSPISYAASGHLQSCAITHLFSGINYDFLYCWGENSYGQLGDGTTTSRTFATRISTTIQGPISLGWRHSCALAGTRAFCWGDNGTGQLGNGSTIAQLAPVNVCTSGTGGTCVPADFTGLAAGGSHTCARRSDGTVWCWGTGSSGQLGNGSTALRTLNPVQASGITTATQVVSGQNFACALLADRSVRCWGDNGRGQLGDGSITQAAAPVTVQVSGGAPLGDVLGLAASGSQACVVRGSAPRVMCWGANALGQLGDGTTTDRSVATAVVDLGP